MIQIAREDAATAYPPSRRSGWSRGAAGRGHIHTAEETRIQHYSRAHFPYILISANNITQRRAVSDRLSRAAPKETPPRLQTIAIIRGI